MTSGQPKTQRTSVSSTSAPIVESLAQIAEAVPHADLGRASQAGARSGTTIPQSAISTARKLAALSAKHATAPSVTGLVPGGNSGATASASKEQQRRKRRPDRARGIEEQRVQPDRVDEVFAAAPDR